MKRSLKIDLGVWLVVATMMSSLTYAKDFGIEGHIFEIAEEDILVVIRRQLEKIDINKINKEHQEKVRAYAHNPKAACSTRLTQQHREFYYDPVYVVKEDIKDHEGRLLHKAGRSVNPLDYLALREALIFIDGDDQRQINSAIDFRRRQNNKCKIVLVKGSPSRLQSKYKVIIYFDQGGVLVKKLGITQTPAAVIQEGKLLKITEFKVRDVR